MRLSRLTTALAAVAALIGTGLLVAPGSEADPSVGTAGTPVETTMTVVRPVTADGHPADGWTVHRETDLKVRCSEAAGAAVDDGIGACFPTVAYAPSCWKSGHHTVLCLRDPRKQQLVRLSRQGAFGAYTAPEKAQPQALVLGGGQSCQVRFGGAWSAPESHPQWVGFYTCDHGSVYAPGSSTDGIIDRDQPWRVRIWVAGTKGRIVHRDVAQAYFVGTAA